MILLSTSDRMELLNKIGKIYNLELICFKEFTAFGKSTYTAVYRSHNGIDFVFVPGDTVTLGFDFKNKPFQDIFNDENLADLAIHLSRDMKRKSLVKTMFKLRLGKR